MTGRVPPRPGRRWVDGPRREAGDVDPPVRELVRQMQRRAFEVTAGWDDIEARELDQPRLTGSRRSGCPPWFSWARSISRRSTRRPGAWPTELLARALLSTDSCSLTLAALTPGRLSQSALGDEN